MARTFADMLDEARDLLQDSDDPQRYSDTQLLRALNRGIQEMARVRPDALWDFFVEEDLFIPEVVVTDPTPDTDPDVLDEDEDAEVALTDDVFFPMQFYNAIVYFIVATADIVEDEYATDGRAALMLSQFKEQLVSL